MPKVGFKSGQDLRDERLPAIRQTKRAAAPEPMAIPKNLADQLMQQRLQERALEFVLEFMTFFSPSEEKTLEKLKELRALYKNCLR